MKFNAPPNWPLPAGFTPPPNWLPERSWPPAPPGWQFWTADEDGPLPSLGPNVAPWAKERRANPRVAVWSAVVALVAVAAGVTAYVQSGHGGQGPSAQSAATVSVGSVVATTSSPVATPAPPPAKADLAQWKAFGGIDARISGGGSSVLLDTHDTTDTWKTKWSGLIAQGPVRCTMHLHARVRDVSHAAGVPGGYGIGLAVVQSPDSADPTLEGWAVQYDFGQQGYRIATYPDDGDEGLVSAAPDHDWHDVDVSVGTSGQVIETMDGVVVVRQQSPNGCGQPVIRVWAGAAEFDDVVVG